MRITSGEFRNRKLQVPKQDVRPAADRVREAVFSMLGNWIEGRRVLDLYAGTGSYGLEAISRGAAIAEFVEGDRNVARILQQNIDHCGVPLKSARVHLERVEAFLGRTTAVAPFDLVFADPPYAESTSGELLQNTLQALEGRPMVKPEGFLVFELPRTVDAQVAEAWELVRDRKYGKSRILLYRRNG